MKKPVFALVDCNNFFVSCEKVFRPDLEGRPVVTLSSGDGCVIARSNEAKALGIPMGAPAFKYRQLFQDKRVVQFSANFELYANIARRITQIMIEITPRIEVYSIDEAFLDLSQLEVVSYEIWGKALRQRILQEVGIPVSIGIAPTKTLAKLASDRAKKDESLGGVLSFISRVGDPTLNYMEQFAIEDIWGVGRRLTPTLKALGNRTAGDLSRMNPLFAQQVMGIRGRQMVYELTGHSCFPLEKVRSTRKSIARTRTFGEDTNELNVVEAAIASFAAQAAFRLRLTGQLATRASLFITTSRHKPGYRTWTNEVSYDPPTADSGTLMQSLTSSLTKIFDEAQLYHRAGVWLYDFVPASPVQSNLLDQAKNTGFDRSIDRMQAIDTINERYGRGTMRFAAEDLAKTWQPKRQLRSPAYTYKWEELPRAKQAK